MVALRGKMGSRVDLKTVKELLPEMLTAEASFNQRGLEDSLRVVGFQAILSRYWLYAGRLG